MMEIASVQMNIGDEDKSKRIERARALLDQVKNVDLVILPEIWNIGYFSFDLYDKESKPIDGETYQRMSIELNFGCPSSLPNGGRVGRDVNWAGS